MRLRLLRLVALVPLLASACALPLQGAPAVPPEVLDARSTFSLQNGMEVLLIQTPSPLVASLVLVKAGGSDETFATAGASHLLEHILFDGTARRTKEELFREVYGMGGYLNGFTSEDYTGYILMAHPDFLEKILDIQADILFHSSFDPAKLEVTKEVVIEEIRQGLTRPATREADAHQARLYRGTSYEHPTIGNELIIRGLTRDEILAYYRAHYIPNNMALVLIGPMDQQSARAKIQQAFGAFPPRPLSPRPSPPPAPPARPEVFVEETAATRKSLTLSLIVPASERDRFPAWEVLTGVLDDGLQRAKERSDSPPILRLGAGFSVYREFGLLQITGAFPRETDEAAVRRLVDRVLSGLAAGPVTSEEVARARKGLVAEEVLLRERIHYYAMEKASRVVALGTAAARGYEGRIGRTTAETVADLAKSLAEPRYVESLFLPAPSATQTASAEKVSAPQRTVLPNGLTLIAQQVPGSRVFAAHVLVKGRSAFEPGGQGGLVEALLRLLSRGTAHRNTEELSKALQDIGARLETAGDPTSPFGDFYTSREYGYVRLEALAEHSRDALSLLAEILMEPRLDALDVEKVRGELRAFVEAGAQQPRRVAESLLFRSLFSEAPLAQPIYGTIASIGNIRREDLLALKGRYLVAGNMLVSIVSDLPPQAAIAVAGEALGRLPAGGPSGPAAALPVSRGVREVRERLGKPQAQLLLGKVLPAVGPRERLALELAGSILSAKLFGTLREQEGLAYSVDAGVSFPQGGALFLIGMGTAPQNVERATTGILREWKSVAETPPTQEEVTRRANGLAGRLTMRLLSSINRAFYLDVAEFRGWGLEYAEAYRQSLLSVTPDEVADVVRRYLGQDDYVLAIVE
ncbi:MAG TPA: pitrilysin family protein [Candidatus Methylomirabilis sp.]|nr:pitrilysin family protein [Candidatus Methylomirabilis sp.]